MIRADRGTIHINGRTPDILSDITTILHSVTEHFTETFGPDMAEKLIDAAVELSKLDEDTLENGDDEEVAKSIMEKVMGGTSDAR
ncbi:MAG: hypothetical protein QM793_06630 [Muricomes sp.]